MEILVDLVGNICWDWCVALDKISLGFKLGNYPGTASLPFERNRLNLSARNL
jgi:hypothetical protein